MEWKVEFRPDLVVVPPHRGAVHISVSGNHSFAGHAGVRPEIDGDLRVYVQDQMLPP